MIFQGLLFQGLMFQGPEGSRCSRPGWGGDVGAELRLQEFREGLERCRTPRMPLTHQRHQTFLFTFLFPFFLLGAAPCPGPGQERVRGPRGEGASPGGVPEQGEGSQQHRELVPALGRSAKIREGSQHHKGIPTQGRGPKIGEGSQNKGEIPAAGKSPSSGEGSRYWGGVPAPGGGSRGSLGDPRPSELLSRRLFRNSRRSGVGTVPTSAPPRGAQLPPGPDTRSVPKIPFIPEIPSVPAPMELRERKLRQGLKISSISSGHPSPEKN